MDASLPLHPCSQAPHHRAPAPCASMCTPTSGCTHMQVCHSVHVSPCAPVCAHMHVCGGPSRALSQPGALGHYSCHPCQSFSLCTWPGPCPPALCLPMYVHVCHCQGSGVGGVNVSPPSSIGEEGVWRGLPLGPAPPCSIACLLRCSPASLSSCF